MKRTSNETKQEGLNQDAKKKHKGFTYQGNYRFKLTARAYSLYDIDSEKMVYFPFPKRKKVTASFIYFT